MPPQSTRSLWKLLAYVLCLLALGSVAILFAVDWRHRMNPSVSHTQAASAGLIGIGLAYIALQFQMARPRLELVKGFLLGLAFVAWGTEQLLPLSSHVVLMDEGVVGVFVIDLGLIIVEHLRRRDHETP